MRFRTCLFCAALVVAAIAPVRGAAAQNIHVEGTVRDDHGQPIRGASIRAENPEAIPTSFSTTSNEKGSFALMGLRPGQWTFTAQAPGFAQESTKIPVRALSTGPTITFTLQKVALPEPTGVLAGVNTGDLQTDLAAADTLFNQQKWDDAIAAYRAILTRTPALTVINLQLGTAYRNMKDYDSAAASYNVLLKADPSNGKARAGLAMTDIERGDLDAAEELMRKVVAAPNVGADELYTFGEIKRAKKEDEDAAKYYWLAADTDPGWGKPLFRLAALAAARGDNAAATLLLQKVVAVDPLSPEAIEAKTLLGQIKK